VAQFRPGDRVWWWKRIGDSRDFPYRAKVVAIGPKLVTILVEDLDDPTDRFTRHVASERLQLVAGYFEKVVGQLPAIREPAASWGPLTTYAEIGDDLHILRQVDAFNNGHMLSYDREHWIDDFGLLGDARINRNLKRTEWWTSEEIDAAEFERVWSAARASPLWPQQMATALMERTGAVPTWFRIEARRPAATQRRKRHR
jgi:hypothetical protein